MYNIFLPSWYRAVRGSLGSACKGRPALSLLAACFPGLEGKAPLVEFGTEGSEEAPKRDCELDGDEYGFIVGGPSMVAKGNQEGRVSKRK